MKDMRSASGKGSTRLHRRRTADVTVRNKSGGRHENHNRLSPAISDSLAARFSSPLSAIARPHNSTLRSKSFTSLRHFVCAVETPVAVNVTQPGNILFKTTNAGRIVFYHQRFATQSPL